MAPTFYPNFLGFLATSAAAAPSAPRAASAAAALSTATPASAKQQAGGPGAVLEHLDKLQKRM